MIASDIVSLQDRGRYQGILGSCIGLGNAIGPFMSAGFTQSSKTSRRGLFSLIAPLMVCSGVASFFLLPPTPMPKGQALQKARLVDWWGLLTGTVAIVLLLIPVSGGGSYFPWKSLLVISMLSISEVAIVAFLLVEWKVSKLPMVPMRMFKTPAVAAILLQNFLFGYVYYLELYYLPIYYQNARQVSPIVSAALLTPLGFSQMFFSVGSGFYISKSPAMARSYGPGSYVGHCEFPVTNVLFPTLETCRTQEIIVQWSRSSLHSRQRDQSRRANHCANNHWYWRGQRFSAVPRRNPSALAKGSSRSGDLEPQFPPRSWRCGWPCLLKRVAAVVVTKSASRRTETSGSFFIQATRYWQSPTKRGH